MPTSDLATKYDRDITICRQEIGPLILLMERACEKGVSPQYASYYMLCKLRCVLKHWERDGLLEPEDEALRQAIKHAASLAFARWNDHPLNEWLGKSKLELVAGRKMRRTK